VAVAVAVAGGGTGPSDRGSGAFARGSAQQLDSTASLPQLERREQRAVDRQEVYVVR
jgi:hypothetical protein